MQNIMASTFGIICSFSKVLHLIHKKRNRWAQFWNSVSFFCAFGAEKETPRRPLPLDLPTVAVYSSARWRRDSGFNGRQGCGRVSGLRFHHSMGFICQLKLWDAIMGNFYTDVIEN